MILAFDTSTKACSVAVGQGNGEVLGQTLVHEAHYVHAERLLPMIDALLGEHSLPRSAITAVAFSGGPGSYTGLRIGASTAKAIAHAAGVPILPVDTCEAVAAGAVRRGDARPGMHVYATLDARRMEVYTAGFLVTAGGGLERIGETKAAVVEGEGVISVDEAFPQISSADQGACFVGDGALKLAELLAEEGRWFVDAVPEARDVLGLGASQWTDGGEGDLAYFEPTYLKEFAAALPKNPLGLGRLSRDRMPEHLR